MMTMIWSGSCWPSWRLRAIEIRVFDKVLARIGIVCVDFCRSELVFRHK